ncbi:hypothetical protein SAMN05444411_101195 [Lutibacter oricola]|uniref:Nicotinic acid mononucleotide adenyltransferase n=1 Tax=Lutibacter oricola TaxID=762486 RepID=A0A1H2RD16_9FLAO|nr:hypothetical protein [Lutibacter oricola]SDW16734.1 hypothetical protein SAMN05444411_101195 [Lutibacter oricola]
MKTLKLLFATLVLSIAVTSCSTTVNGLNDDDFYYATLEDIISTNDIWYVDYNETTGTGDIPFMSKAFTISFLNGKLYANNNLVGIGSTGNGYGIQIGYYNTNKGYLEIDHDIDGFIDFDVIEINSDRIKLSDNYNNVTYTLEGYQKYNFDFDKIFYENIEYLLQEFEAWEKSYVSDSGDVNEFDNENFLAFTPENITTFYSSKDEVGTNIANILWDYVGGYEVYDVQGYENLKILTLDYDSYGTEEFELTVINDDKIELYHVNSGTTYEFDGLNYIQYKKSAKGKGSTVSNEGRKRTKVKRATKIRKKH